MDIEIKIQEDTELLYLIMFFMETEYNANPMHFVACCGIGAKLCIHRTFKRRKFGFKKLKNVQIMVERIVLGNVVDNKWYALKSISSS